MDTEIIATLKAIRSKDPRVYDKDAKFYTTVDTTNEPAKEKKEKPLHLQDYHRQNLLNGSADADEDNDQPLTYNQEQEQLKMSIVQEMHAVAEPDDESSDAGGDLMVAKQRPKRTLQQEPALDVENADKDPETFLSNFMSSRAWAYPNERNLQPFESDDEEEERKADEFEEAYNFRFEDPTKSNETLKSHARDMAAKYSVRRSETNPRQKRREADKTEKEAEKQERREEKARLRKLRVEEVEEKVRRIKRAGGFQSKDLQPEDWAKFVNDDWDDAQWEQEMQKRFDDKYYAEDDVDSEVEGNLRNGKKLKKPKFDEDIDIKDIVPDFEDENDQAQFSLSEDGIETLTEKPSKKKVSTKEAKRREAKKDRRIIEQLVDAEMHLDLDQPRAEPAKQPSAFRYRETSPQSFGLSSRDILMADDSQLNQFAGLKKLSAFRDVDKKRKDRKHLGKKARLRKWRQEVFGNEDGIPQSELVPTKPTSIETEGIDDNADGGVNVLTSGKKKRRRPKKKQKTSAVET